MGWFARHSRPRKEDFFRRKFDVLGRGIGEEFIDLREMDVFAYFRALISPLLPLKPRISQSCIYPLGKGLVICRWSVSWKPAHFIHHTRSLTSSHLSRNQPISFLVSLVNTMSLNVLPTMGARVRDRASDLHAVHDRITVCTSQWDIFWSSGEKITR